MLACLVRNFCIRNLLYALFGTFTFSFLMQIFMQIFQNSKPTPISSLSVFSTRIHKISCLLFKFNTNVRTFILCYLITYILRGFLFWERIMVFCDNFCMSDLNITSWNIHGIFNRIEGFRYNKTHSPHFWDMIGDSKIFGLIETHHLANEIDQIQIAGFKCFNVSRKKSW